MAVPREKTPTARARRTRPVQLPAPQREGARNNSRAGDSDDDGGSASISASPAASMCNTPAARGSRKAPAVRAPTSSNETKTTAASVSTAADEDPYRLQEYSGKFKCIGETPKKGAWMFALRKEPQIKFHVTKVKATRQKHTTAGRIVNTAYTNHLRAQDRAELRKKKQVRAPLQRPSGRQSMRSRVVPA